MTSTAPDARRDVRYEPDEQPPHPLSLGLGLQYAMIAVPTIVLGPTIMIRTAGGLAAERPDDVLVQRRVSLRLLRRNASSVLHQQFHETDTVTVHVDAPGTVTGGL